MSTNTDSTEAKRVIEGHPVVSDETWLAARKALLAKEKELTRQMDAVSAARRALPWAKVSREYTFDTPNGAKSLGDLFDGRSQLIVYHFMFGPGWKEGCGGCSFIADHMDGVNLHLAHHDVTLLCVSRAPLAELMPFKERMGWHFEWVSSHGSDFNEHYQASGEPNADGKIYYNYDWTDGEGSEHHGVSVFYKNPAGEIFHTYSTYARGGDILLGVHNFLDLTPKGRNEEGTMSWVRLHDEYEGACGQSECGCQSAEAGK